ncbi:MAG: hypothetical protein A2267_02525 [Omnitrophica WOR_2 bacterium RIFOXYA12_FULL_38_10]|nr:MAG: hypothetical protein A2267_02525 [Omnitrophica WOR_2 bacterium RIFOXYA12_FULL_38_10]
MAIISDKISLSELRSMAKNVFGDLVKAVVDVETGVIALDAELHSDLEGILLQNGSLQKNLWGINLYPGIDGEDFIEFDSMINMRPSISNMSRGVEDEKIRSKIRQIVAKRITK